MTFNINLWSIKKATFGSLCYSVLSWQRVCQGVLEIFWSYRSIMFHYNEILKVFKSEIWLGIWHNHPKISLNIKLQPNHWVNRFGSYEHLKFRPTHLLKYRLWRHNYLIVMTSQFFCYHCVEYIKLDTCVKFLDHRSNNKVIMGGEIPPQKNNNWRLKKPYFTWAFKHLLDLGVADSSSPPPPPPNSLVFNPRSIKFGT